MTISNINIEVVRKDIKNLHLGVYPPDGRVRIASPLRIDDESVRLFAISKLGWIKKQVEKFNSQERLPNREFRYRETHYYMGQKYLLKIQSHNAKARIELKDKKHITMHIKEGATTQQMQKAMDEWYRDELKRLIPPIIAKFEDMLGVSVDEFCIKKMKTKWGACNIKARRIWLNLELAKRDEKCLEYIVLHEMVHLLERNHTARFTVLMDAYMSQWRSVKEELGLSPLEV
jgi:predicted metal-dependent hydrolase